MNLLEVVSDRYAWTNAEAYTTYKVKSWLKVECYADRSVVELDTKLCRTNNSNSSETATETNVCTNTSIQEPLTKTWSPIELLKRVVVDTSKVCPATTEANTTIDIVSLAKIVLSCDSGTTTETNTYIADTAVTQNIATNATKNFFIIQNVLVNEIVFTNTNIAFIFQMSKKIS